MNNELYFKLIVKMLKKLYFLAGLVIFVFLGNSILQAQSSLSYEQQIRKDLNYALGLYLQKHYQEATTQCRALIPFIESANHLDRKIKKLCDVYFMIGSCMYHLNNSAAAAVEFEKILDLNSDYIPTEHIASSEVKAVFESRKRKKLRVHIIPPESASSKMRVSPKKFLERISLRFSGGYSTLCAGDVDKDIEEINRYSHDAANYYRSKFGDDAEALGEHNPLKGGFGGGGEILISVIENLKIGLGFEYISRTKDSRINNIDKWNMGRSFNNYTRDINEKIVLTGILFKLNYQLPISSNFALFFDAGVGYYLTKINYDLDCNGEHEFWRYGWHYTSSGWDHDWFKYEYGEWRRTNEFEIRKNKIGLSGGLGIDISLSKNLSIFVEGKGRYLNLGEVEATEIWDAYLNRKRAVYLLAWGTYDLRFWDTYSYEDHWQVEGPLYLYDNDLLDNKYSFITSNKQMYSRYIYTSNFRKAKINISGFNVIFGIRIKIF